jgi:Tfp pilus assembly protein PilO
MMDRLLRALDRKDPRLPPLIALILIGFLLLEGWLLVLRKPFNQYQQLTNTAQSLALRVSTRGGPSTEIAQLRQDIEKFDKHLQGELSLVQSTDIVVAPLMDQLDQSARAAGLRLSGVSPGVKRSVAGFDERPFELTVTGAYLPLARWLLDFGETLGQNVVVTDLDLRATGQTDQLKLSMRIALYLPLTGAKSP